MNQLRITMMAVLALALAAPVAATADSGKGKTKSAEAKAKKAKQAQFKGEVTGVDATAGTVTVLVEKASKWGRAYKGKSVVFTLEGVKKLKVADTDADGDKDINDIKTGDRAHAGARIAKGTDVTLPVAANKFHAKAAPAPAPAP